MIGTRWRLRHRREALVQRKVFGWLLCGFAGVRDRRQIGFRHGVETDLIAERMLAQDPEPVTGGLEHESKRRVVGLLEPDPIARRRGLARCFPPVTLGLAQRRRARAL